MDLCRSFAIPALVEIEYQKTASAPSWSPSALSFEEEARQLSAAVSAFKIRTSAAEVYAAPLPPVAPVARRIAHRAGH